MPLQIARIEEAITYVLRNPTTLGPLNDGVTGDANRDTAIQDLDAIDYSTHLTWTPEGSTSPFAITIQKLGGLQSANVGSLNTTSAPVISVTTWAQTTGNRTKLSDLLDLGILVRVLLQGLRGTWAGVVVKNILTENEPFLSDEQPSDASDNYASGYTFDFVCYYEPTLASARIATGS